MHKISQNKVSVHAKPLEAYVQKTFTCITAIFLYNVHMHMIKDVYMHHSYIPL